MLSNALRRTAAHINKKPSSTTTSAMAAFSSSAATAMASRAKPVPLVLSPRNLASLLDSNSAERPVILDCSWHMPNVQPPRNANEEYKRGPRLPGALRWDPDAIATRGPQVRDLPHMMPSPEQFAGEAAKRGIRPDTHVVCYDTAGVFSSPRAAFTFAAFGHDRISVLDGGMPAWVQAGLPIDSNATEQESNANDAAASSDYPTPRLQPGWIRSYDEVLANTRSPKGQPVLDARARPRYDGTAPEPRAGMSSGHIPKSLSLPFTEVLDRHEGGYTTLKDQVALYRSLRTQIADGTGNVGEGAEGWDFETVRQASSAGEPAVVATCGSGMTAAVLWLALRTVGVQASVYDESWMGWAGREAAGEGTPIDKTTPMKAAESNDV